MCRAPHPGHINTRLISTLGAHGACELQMACLRDILSEASHWCAQAANRQLHFFYTPSHCLDAFEQWGVHLPRQCRSYPQTGENLEQRMEHAIATVQAVSPQDNPVLLVGSDLPLLTCQHWDQALCKLANHDLVFGPSLDGGYYLLGTRVPLNDLLRPAKKEVLQHNLKNARAHQLTCSTIAPLPDLDIEADLWQVLDHPQAAQLAQRRSLKWLKRWQQQITTIPASDLAFSKT